MYFFEIRLNDWTLFKTRAQHTCDGVEGVKTVGKEFALKGFLFKVVQVNISWSTKREFCDQEQASNRCWEPARTWRDERKLLGMVAADDGGAGQSPLLYVRWAGCPCGPVCLPVCLCVCTSLCVPPCVPVCAGVHLPLCASVSVRAFPSRYAALGRTRGPGTRTSASRWSTLALLLYHEEPKDKDQKNPEILAHS